MQQAHPRLQPVITYAASNWSYQYQAQPKEESVHLPKTADLQRCQRNGRGLEYLLLRCEPCRYGKPNGKGVPLGVVNFIPERHAKAAYQSAQHCILPDQKRNQEWQERIHGCPAATT